MKNLVPPFLFLAVFLAAFANAAEEGQPCSGDLYTEKCEDQSSKPLDLRKDKTEADGVLFNYFLVNKREHADKIRAFNSSAPNDLQQRGRKIAENMRAQAIKLVMGGRSAEDLPPDIAAIVQRLRTVTISLSEPSDSACYDKSDPGIPNASYSQIEHRIGICPATLKVPSQEIAATIAHELGHAITPCAMSRSLIKVNETAGDIGACLLKIGSGDERSAEDQEIWGTGAISIATISDTGYTVDIDEKRNAELVNCGAARRMPGSQLKDPVIYRPISTCLEKRYQSDYENYIAKKAFQLEKMPDFSKLPGRAKTEWPKLAEQTREAYPYGCFVKKEEHFADAFGGQVYSAWIQEQNQSVQKFDTGLHFLTNIQCVEKISKNAGMSKFEYPPVSDRISLFLTPAAAAHAKRCTPPSKTICTLASDVFDGSARPANQQGGSRSGGTTP